MNIKTWKKEAKVQKKKALKMLHETQNAVNKGRVAHKEISEWPYVGSLAQAQEHLNEAERILKEVQ